MLTDLHIKDVVLIDSLTLNCENGFTALTGETGAGKSIVLDALGLALGVRAESRLIRQGAASAQVTASFTVTQPHCLKRIQAVFAEQGLDFEQPILLRRVLQEGGKSKAFLNDQPVSTTVLKTIGEMLVEIHGQFDTHELLEAKSHRATLDAYAGHDALVTDVHNHWTAWRQAQQVLQELRDQLARATRERDYLQATIDELEKLNPLENEEQQLAAQRALMMHAEKSVQAISEAYNALTHDKGARSGVGLALRGLERMADKTGDLLDAPINGLNQAVIEIDEVVGQLESLLHRLQYDQNDQAKTDERLFALRGAARKYQVTVEQLPDVLANAKRDLAQLNDQSDLLKRAEKNVAAQEVLYHRSAQTLSQSRTEAATQLAAAVLQELPPLKLERAQFAVDVAPKQPSADGVDQVTFMVSMNAGTALAPLHKVASGGEMARLMLAMKLVTQNTDRMPTMIFDEIDTGVSGAVAEAIGLRLRRLGTQAQVFSVTHAPQVAAKAHQHFRIQKESTAKVTRTTIVPLDDSARVDEIARLLSGEKITAAARDAATHLLMVEEEVNTPAKKRKTR
jgi:DNA repair protein RecN (Recombination protein N)